MRRQHLNFGLLAVVVALGAVVWQSQEPKDKPSPLTSLDKTKIDRIRIEHPGAPAIALEKHDEVWRLTAPVEAQADPFETSALLGLADTGIQARVEGARLKDLGLEPAAYSVILNKTRIDFGGEEPIQYRRYVRVDEQPPVLIHDAASAAFDRDYSDLVAKNLLPDHADITRIAAPGLSIEKTAGDSWVSPDHPQARSEQLRAVVSAWKSAQSMWNAAMTAGDEKAEAVTLTLADGRTVAFTLVAREPQLILASPTLGLRYTLAKTDVDRLLQLPAAVTASAKKTAPPAVEP